MNLLRKKRIEELSKRKNILPAFFVTAGLWFSLLFLVFLVDPYEGIALPAFFVLIFLALFFTFSILFEKKRRGMIMAVAVTILLILRYFGISTVFNTFLVVALLATVEYYFTRQT